MVGILDRVAQSALSRSYNQFHPTTQRDFFTLRLAEKLNDAHSAQHYADLAERHSEASMLTAYRRARSAGSQRDMARRFHAELERLNGRNRSGYSDDHRL